MPKDQNIEWKGKSPILFQELSKLIEQGKRQVTAQINSTMTLVYWQVGKRINEDILGNKRSEYGKQIVSTLSSQLTEKYGKSFSAKNLHRMRQFAEIYPEQEIVVSAIRQLSWTHIIAILPIKSPESRTFYIQQIAANHWSVRETRKQIELKAFERSLIANTQLPTHESETADTFKDSYLLDFLGLKEGYLEEDLESAILRELEQFILELGKGFAFIERQKRMIIDGEDFYLDLLFYHRKLKRLIALELKVGKFKAAHKGQMELYLKWLNQYERQADEKPPVGIILCTEASREQIELLEMHKDGIMVAEYWTELPPKKLLEDKIHQAFIEAKERLERRKLNNGSD